jgi:cephalosporin-C deacetylase
VSWCDLPEAQLATYRITTPEPADLDSWWADRIDRARSAARPVTLHRYLPECYGDLLVYEVEFSGAGGDRVRGWYLRPAGTGRVPVVVEFPGYGRGRGLPVEHALLPAAGFGLLVMEVRGQGGTPAPEPERPDGRAPNVLAEGIFDLDGYYFTPVFVDAVRAVDTAALLPGADPERIAVSGGSQGGGLALAAAALSGDRVRVCHAEVPMFCDLQRAIVVSAAGPYPEVARYLAGFPERAPAALETLRYVDCALLARRITARCLVAVGLRDPESPPSTVYAAFHEIRAPKELAVAALGDHRVPRTHAERKLRHLRENLA